MAGDLLHIIRDAEKKAEKITSDANKKAQIIIDNARTETKKMLMQIQIKKDEEKSDYLFNVKEKAQYKLKELEIQFEEDTKKIKESALKNKKKAIDYVVDSILKKS